MAHPTEYEKHDFSKYDNMTTEELEEILRAQFFLADENNDDQLIEHILEVLTERDEDKINTGLQGPEPSWEKFLQNHPDIQVETSSIDCEKGNVELLPTERPAKKMRFLRRVGCIAAIFACILFAGTITAYAMGIDVPGAIAEWTSEVFGFIYTPSDEQSDRVVPSQLEGLYEELNKYVSDAPFPSYLPAEYRLIDTQTQYDGEIRKFSCFLSNGEQNIVIYYVIHYSNNGIIEYEKNDVNPEIIIVDSIKYYIFSNTDQWIATWISGNVEGSISTQSEDELIKIIESMK